MIEWLGICLWVNVCVGCLGEQPVGLGLCGFVVCGLRWFLVVFFFALFCFFFCFFAVLLNHTRTMWSLDFVDEACCWRL